MESENSILKSWMTGDTQEHELRDVVLTLTSTVRLIFVGKQIVPLRFVSKKEPLLINENMIKRLLNLGLPCKFSCSSMSTHHCSLAFLFSLVRYGLILLVCFLTFPSFMCFTSVFLKTSSALHASSRVVLSLRGVLRVHS
jgi:hypothetical protein